jgi:protein tyrosine phosphatase
MNCYCYDIVYHRYGNIIPYNHNQVTLDHQVDGIDYVNASWIKNDDQTSQMPNFIAAQGLFVRYLFIFDAFWTT